MTVRIVIVLLSCAALAGCGEERVREAGPGAVFEPGVGKPNAFVGSLDAAIVERPTRDRARIRATWRRAAGVEGCELQLHLPHGVLLLEGEAVHVLTPDELEGERTWLVAFPTGAVLDATVRLCGDAGRGVRICDSYVRLTR